MRLEKRLFYGAITLTIAMHFFGFLGMVWSVTRLFFEALTPLNLLINTFFLIYFQKSKNNLFYGFCILIFLLGWGVEVAGVQTRILFGAYDYGATLGWKLWDVPLVMGCNWLMLILLIGTAFNFLKMSVLSKTILGASLLVFLDVLIEPVAITHDFWQWEGGIIPLQNYLMWWLAGALFLFLFYRFDFEKKNRYVSYLLLSQFFFFLAHNLLYLVKTLSQ